VAEFHDDAEAVKALVVAAERVALTTWPNG
jgi:hypothetical protein